MTRRCSFPTRNRADHIALSLTSVLESASQAPYDVEVLVVDNGSEDHTAQVLADFCDEWPILRVIDDPVAGKSGVLNRTLEMVKGRVVIFTDDDVHVPAVVGHRHGGTHPLWESGRRVRPGCPCAPSRTVVADTQVAHAACRDDRRIGR